MTECDMSINVDGLSVKSKKKKKINKLQLNIYIRV